MKKALISFGLCLVLFCAGLYLVLPPSKITQVANASTYDVWARLDDPGSTAPQNGTAQYPWIIRNQSDLTTRLPAGNAPINSSHCGQHFILMDNIALTTSYTARTLAPNCVFDGNNFVISNLRFTTGTEVGFFARMSGTLKNITFDNANVTGSTYGAVAAARVWSVAPPPGVPDVREATFSRVFVKGVNITGSGHSSVVTDNPARNGFVSGSSMLGGLVGEIANGCKVTIDSCLNRANITGASVGHVGGLVGRSGQEGTGCELYVARSGNEGTVQATGGISNTVNGVGGIVGCVDGGPTTVEYCYNRGEIQRGHGGMIGMVRVSSGRATIMNCFNDAPVGTNNPTGSSAVYKAGITLRISSTIIWAQNNWLNQTKFTGSHFIDSGNNIVTDPNINNNHFFTTTNLGNPTWLEDVFLASLNSGAEMPPFIIVNGKVELFSLTRTRPMTFLPCFENGVMHQEHLDMTATTFNKFPNVNIIGQRIGYNFLGWLTSGDPTIYLPGNNFNIDTAVDGGFVFEAQWALINYTVNFDAGCGQLRDASNTPVTFFNIGQSGLTLHPNVWSGTNYWMIKKSDESSYDVLSSTQIFSLSSKVPVTTNFDATTACATFLENYVDGKTSSTPYITLAIINTNSAHIVDLTANNPEGGRFGYSLVSSPSIVEWQDPTTTSAFYLPKGELINSFHIEVNAYYDFQKIEIINGGSTVATITSPETYSYSGSLFDLGDDINGIQTGFQFNVVFDKIPFVFDIRAELKDNPSYVLPSGLINNTSDASIMVNSQLKIAVAARKEPTGVFAFSFAGWEIYDNAAGEYVQLFPTPETDIGGEIFVTYNNGSGGEFINSNWLDNHLSDPGAEGVLKVRLVAKYVRMYKVEIADGGFKVTKEYFDNNTGSAGQGWPVNDLIPEGSYVFIETYTSRYLPENDPSFFYNFDGFVDEFGTPIAEQSSPFGSSITSTVIESISGNRILIPKFSMRSFGVDFEARAISPEGVLGYTIGHNLVLDYKFDNETSPSLQNKLVAGDKFTVEDPVISGAVFQEFRINGKKIDLTSGAIEATELFLKENLVKNKITVTACYQLPSILRAKVSDASMGKIVVYNNAGITVDQGSSVSIPYYVGGEFKIEAVEFFGYISTGFGDTIQQSEETQDINIAKVSAQSGRSTIVAAFQPRSFTINGSLKEKGWGTSSWNLADTKTAEFERLVGDERYVVIVANAGFVSEVKNWYINTEDIKYLSNVTREGNTITIKMTSEWLQKYPDKLESVIEFGLTTEFMLFVLLPLGIIILLGIAFLIYYLNLQRKKRIIKASLLADKRARAGFTQHNLVSDVREGRAVGGVSDDAIKRAMDAEKEKKKDEKG